MNSQEVKVREKLLMDRDWKFFYGDFQPTPAIDASTTCYASKAESARGAAAHSFYDNDWETISLPHDYAVSGTPYENGNQAHGYLNRGAAWYRKSFILDPNDEQKRLSLIFDGVATNCTVWVNGVLMCRNFSGFNSFETDISEVVFYNGLPNVIAVRVDTDLYGMNSEAFEGWWYDGAGIYRHVWLEKTSPIHIVRDGIWILPEKKGHGFEIPVEVTIANDTLNNQEAKIFIRIISKDEKEIVSTSGIIQINANSKNEIKLNLYAKNVNLWDLENPYLYHAEVSIYINNNLVDLTETKFGFRTILFDANKGFFLNDKHVKIKGTSNHQDHGCLGTALSDNMFEWRIKKLKEMGCNGWRCAHNTVAPEMLDACDRLGMLVMSENRWFVPGEENIEIVSKMIRRERNHPSIIAWSIGNEEPLQCEPRGRKIAEKLIATVKQLDTTRPCTLASNGGFFEKQAVASTDVIGMNYFPWLYDEVHMLYHDKAIISTEASCSNNCRGVYELNPVLNRFTAYDHHAPSFGSNHRDAWKYVNERDFISGIFFWTGYEYRGETKWPSLFAEVGMLDSNGFPKDNYYLIKVLWTKKPMVHLLPHWSLQKPSEQIEVYAYSNCDSVELFLNKKSLGKQTIDPYIQAKWLVTYEPGTLEAIAYTDGIISARDILETCKNPIALNMCLENPEVKANGEETALFTVFATDEKGNSVPWAEPEIEIAIEGDAKFLGAGASPIDTTPVISKKRKLYNGLLQIAVRVGETGKFKIKTTSVGLATAELDMHIQSENPRPYVPSSENYGLLNHWWMSVVFDTPRTPENFRHRMPTEPGMSFPLFQYQKGYGMMYLATAVPKFSQGKKAVLHIEEITGEAEIWIRLRNCNPQEKNKDKDMLKENVVKINSNKEEHDSCIDFCKSQCEVHYKKISYDPQEIELILPTEVYTGDTPIHIWIGLKGDDKDCGITGKVKWRLLDC